MEKLPAVKLLSFHPDTLLTVRQEWDLDQPGIIDEAIDLLEIWIQKQAHFVRKDFERGYLERVVVLCKGSVERAKKKLDKMCTLKTLTPHLFDATDIKTEMSPVFKKFTIAIMPKLTENHERAIVCDIMTDDIETDCVYLCAKWCTMMSEYLKRHDYSRGLIGISDSRSVNNLLVFFAKVNPIVFCDLVKIFTDLYGLRLVKVFFISESKAAEHFLNMFKQFLSEKISERIVIVKSHTELANHLSASTLEVLPMEYGGQDKSIKDVANDWLEELSLPDNMAYYNEIKQFKTEEAFRQTDKVNETYMGMPGTFKTLRVD